METDLNALQLEKYPTLVVSLGDLLDVLCPMTAYLFPTDSDNYSARILGRKVSVPWKQDNPFDENKLLKV